MKNIKKNNSVRPLVSIGMPIRNGEPFLEETLHSLISQTIEDFELIISDNASEDKTGLICQQYAEKDCRIRYHRFNTNVGAAKNYNYVFKLSQGKYFKWAAHDDICLPNYLGKCIEVFEQASASVVLVYPKTEFIDGEGRHLKFDSIFLDIKEVPPHRRLANFINNIHFANPLFGVIRTSSLRKTRLIDTFIKSDYVLLAELLMIGEFYEIPEVLFRRRLHENRSILANRNKIQLQHWFDPSSHSVLDFLPAAMRLRVEYARSVCRMPLSASEKLLCLAVVFSVRVMQELRNVCGLYKLQVKKWLVRCWKKKYNESP